MGEKRAIRETTVGERAQAFAWLKNAGNAIYFSAFSPEVERFNGEANS
jgi:hypothetical protein